METMVQTEWQKEATRKQLLLAHAISKQLHWCPYLVPIAFRIQNADIASKYHGAAEDLHQAHLCEAEFPAMELATFKRSYAPERPGL